MCCLAVACYGDGAARFKLLQGYPADTSGKPAGKSQESAVETVVGIFKDLRSPEGRQSVR